MNLPGHILYYSVNTKLSYFINEYFYNSRHFVWCAPVFNRLSLEDSNLYKNIPPSSNPFDIYNQYKKDVDGGDLHSNMIERNKAGLKRGAIRMLEKKVVNQDEYARVIAWIDTATIDKFKPVLYLIPKGIIEPRVIKVPVAEAANPLSTEYQVHDLKKGEFELMEF